MANPAPFPAFTLGITLLAPLCALAQSPFYTDTGSPSNPAWSVVVRNLNNDSPDPGPVAGSVINVNNAATEVGLYGNRPISVGSQRIHIPCNTSTTNLGDFTRWFQTDGNTQVFRLFVNDQNTASTREGAARSEAFQTEKWKYSDGVTYEWTGRYTIARRQQSYAVFQLMNDTNEWGLQLNMTSTGGLLVNNRRNAPDITLTNPDGSTKVFDGKGFDVRVIDDGLNYRCWIDGVLVADNFYDRPTGETNFRWGKYMGNNFLTSPSTNSVILVSGAQVKSWPGRLDSPTTDRMKANNSQFLGNTASWTGGVLPGIHNRAVWNGTVTATNATTFNTGQTWGGIRITNPGGNVTINGDAILKLENEGIDMSASTRSLTVNCPVEPNVTAPWVIAGNRVATFNNTIRGYQGIALGGSGTLILNAANTYSGPTTINGGVLQIGNGGTAGALDTGSPISVAGGTTFAVNRSNAVTQGTHFSGAAITGAGSLEKSGTGTLTLTAANTYSGQTTVNAGTLAFSNVSPFNNTSGITLSGATSLRPALGGATILSPINVGAAGTTASISAPVNLPGAGVVSALTLAGAIGGDGGVAFTSSADQNALSTIQLNAKSTYKGRTLLDTDGTEATQIIVKLGTANALPTGTVVEIDGQIGQGTGRFAELNLNGYSQQIAGLTNTARSLRTQRIVNSNVSATAVLTVNNAANHTFSGSLGGGAAGSISASVMPGSTDGNNFAVTKGGVGALALAGENSYSGATIVNQGTLTLGSANPNNNASAITIAATGANLGLAFTGTDTVNELFIGGERMPAGIYKAAGNPGAGIGIPQITGTGTLTVSTGSSPPATGYQAWKTANGTDQPSNGDHDGDGVPNGIEYFIGGDGNTTGYTRLPGVTNTAGTLSITWTKSGDYTGSYGTGFIVETSGSLTGIWTTETAEPAPNATVTFPTTNTVRYTFPQPINGKKFARLKVIGS